MEKKTHDLNELVRKAQSGDQDAFGQIITRFQDMAYAVGCSMLNDPILAQDVAQEAFMESYLSLPNLREPAAFTTWFRRILYKRCDRYQRQRRAPVLPLEAALQIPSLEPDPVRLLEYVDAHEAVDHLPEAERLAITLFYLEGYSQKEIASFLDIPVTTLKKRLFTARKRLKKRMVPMNKKQVQENKPSKDEQFAGKVKFFVALQENDFETVKSMVHQNPELVHVTTEWTVASYGYYWPLRATPLFWAAGTGHKPLTEFLISNGADVNVKQVWGSHGTALHEAIKMNHKDIVHILLKRGADVNAISKRGHTPLHYAIFRDLIQMVDLLIEQGADLACTDASGRTPGDWAAEKGYEHLVNHLVAQGAQKPKVSRRNKPVVPLAADSPRQVPVGNRVLGQILDRTGLPADRTVSLPDGDCHPVCSASEMPSPIWHTGIKIIDLMTPLCRGGHTGLFTPLSGIGIEFTINQLIRSMANLHDGYIVYMGLEHDVYTAEGKLMQWRIDMGLEESIIKEKLVMVYGHTNDSVRERQGIVETGLAIAESLRRTGHDVLLIADHILAQTEGIAPYLRSSTVSSPDASITTLYVGDHTTGLEPASLRGLDTTITFSLQRGDLACFPAIDPIRSNSNLINDNRISERHKQLIDRILPLFHRYADLHHHIEAKGLDALFYLYDQEIEEKTVIRARRLHRFLSQPLPGLEHLFGIPGIYVSLEDTIAGCEAILDGKYDKTPEEAFYTVGIIQDVKK